MSDFRCPYCGDGKMVLEIIPEYSTRVGGVPVEVTDAQIAKCTHCGETAVGAGELKRWEDLRRRQLQATGQIPSPDEVKRIRESLGLSVSDLAALLAVTRQTIYAWERRDTGGMQLGPAAILVRLLGDELSGKVKGICSRLVAAALERGQSVKLSTDTEKHAAVVDTSPDKSDYISTLRDSSTGKHQ